MTIRYRVCHYTDKNDASIRRINVFWIYREVNVLFYIKKNHITIMYSILWDLAKMTKSKILYKNDYFFFGFLYFRTASISLVNIFHIHIRLATIKTPLMRNDIFFGRFRTIVSMKNRVKISRFFWEKTRKKYTRKRKKYT